MNRILKTEPVNSVKSIRDLLTIVNEAEDSAWKVHGVSPFDDQTRSIQATKERMKKGKLASTSAGDAPELANNLINSPKSPDMFPTPEKRLFHPADTSYAQDHPSSFIPPEDNENSLSDLDKAPSYSAPQPGTAPKPHPAGKPKTPGAKFDPAVQKLQYELRAKGYPIKANGILDAKTQEIIDWENLSKSRDNAIQDFDALQTTMNEPITAPEIPDENPQGDFERDPQELSESINYELDRIMQITQWK